MIAISIVSHGHGAMVDRLLQQLRDCPEVVRIILTRNIPESSAIVTDGLVEIVDNAAPKGFGANHNAAFAHCREPFYCVLNPDIELSGNPFPGLLRCLEDTGIAMAAPLIIAPDGVVEDSARHFPTLPSLLRKAMGGADGRWPMPTGQTTVFPDWVAGMFMLFRSTDYGQLEGFDPAYFLYYEDVDICARIRRSGRKVALCTSAKAIHDARRESRRSFKHLRWHLASMARFLWRWR